MLVSVAGYLYFLFAFAFHDFHVSVCEVYHNPDSNSLEISMKIFTDDLELAIRQYSDGEFTLLDTEAKNVDSDMLEKYLNQHFQILIDEKDTQLEFVGFEFDYDVILCYLEGKKVRKISTIEIKNEVITEVFADQINLTHFQYNGSMKSLKATREQPAGIIDTSKM